MQDELIVDARDAIAERLDEVLAEHAGEALAAWLADPTAS
jgi:hypothetical protein